MRLIKKSTILALLFGLISSFFSPIYADQGQVLGVHILNTYEVSDVSALFESSDKEKNDQEWRYVTIPFSLDDSENLEKWQSFFDQAKEKKLIPLVRLATKFKDDSWQVPNRYQLVKLLNALSSLNWPTDEKYIIVFNEPNHAKEWGGQIDARGYADVLEFTALWAKTEEKNFKILPAGLDLAASNTSYDTTIDSSIFINQILSYKPEILDNIDYWNSHSYPNPGFSSSPERVGKNSLSGFKYELDYLKNKTGKDFQVFITETGWEDNSYTNRYLASYYTYALQHIWSDSRVKAVTPFILQGAPGPFASFSFLDENGQPTSQYLALQKALQAVN